MRGIYSLTTLALGGSAPLARKIITTFASLMAAFAIISVIFYAIALTRLGPDRSVGDEVSVFLIILGFFGLCSFGGLATLCTKAIAPLQLLIDRVSGKTDFVLLEAPSNTSREIRETYAIFNKMFVRLSATQEALIEGEKHSAIARTTQMLAHDVRKPFSILRMGLDLLSAAKDPLGVKSVLARLMPEIDKAVSSVDGLIADVMEVGSTSTALILEPVSPKVLIDSTLGEVFRVYPKSSISLSYDLQHLHMVNVHVQKVGRVFSNIVGNAVQAVKGRGHIWFRTRQVDGFVEFCIGNAGSVIPPESLPKLFQAFFTSGKKGGTGLGLAIAEKVVLAHGGTIRCESSKTADYPNGKVEFLFLLPIAPEHPCNLDLRLPVASSEISRALVNLDESMPAQDRSDSNRDLGVEVEIIRLSSRLGRRLSILIVDDEAIYRSALISYLRQSEELSKRLDIEQCENSSAALRLVAKQKFDLVVTDVDLGFESMDGFELVREIRAAGARSLVCVHSNRFLSADRRTAAESGADAFLPKPMARSHLLGLVLEGGQVENQALEAGQVEDAIETAQDKKLPTILLVEDNPFVIDAWVCTLQQDAAVIALSTYDELIDRFESNPDFARDLLFAITDLNLDGSSGDGVDVGRLLKRYRDDLCVLLSSDATPNPDTLGGAIDKLIGKVPVSLAELQACPVLL